RGPRSTGTRWPCRREVTRPRSGHSCTWAARCVPDDRPRKLPACEPSREHCGRSAMRQTGPVRFIAVRRCSVRPSEFSAVPSRRSSANDAARRERDHFGAHLGDAPRELGREQLVGVRAAGPRAHDAEHAAGHLLRVARRQLEPGQRAVFGLEVELRRAGARTPALRRQDRVDGGDLLLRLPLRLQLLLLLRGSLALGVLLLHQLLLAALLVLVELLLALLAALHACLVREAAGVLVGQQVRLLELVAEAHVATI